MDRTTALDRLRKERDYEDALVRRLNDNIINKLKDIKDLTEHERDVLKKELMIITSDSVRHEFLFSGLMQQVLEEDERVKY
jgi:hypothetical protein